jgi:hypothetical protein
MGMGGIIPLGTVTCATFIALAPLFSEMVARQVETATVRTAVLEYHVHHLLDHVCTILLVPLEAVNGKTKILPLQLLTNSENMSWRINSDWICILRAKELKFERKPYGSWNYNLVELWFIRSAFYCFTGALFTSANARCSGNNRREVCLITASSLNVAATNWYLF